MLLGIGIRNGAVQLQGLIDDKHIYPMDVAYRLSGGMDFRVVAREKGVNIVRSHLEFALTGEWNGNFERCDEPYGHIYATVCPGLKNGTIARIAGVERIKSLGYVYDYFQYYQEGYTMTHSGCFIQTFCRVFIISDSVADVKVKTMEIMRLLVVEDKDGQSMLINESLS